MNNSYSQLILEQYILNELSDEESLKIMKAIENDDVLRKRVEEIQASNTEISKEIDELDILREIKYRANIKKIARERNMESNNIRPWARSMIAIPLVAVVSMTAVLLKDNFSPSSTTPIEVTEDGIRFKGLKPYINIFKKVDKGIKLVDQLDTLKQGDHLQLSYIAAGQQFGAIISIDGRGVLTQHYPFDSQNTLALSVSGEFLIKRSYQLDDAPKYEHFYFITSKKKFDLNMVIQKARNSITKTNIDNSSIPGLPSELNQYVFTIKKVSK